MKDDSRQDFPLKTLQSDDDGFGLYVHIPHCLQKCTYCDFVKFKVGEIPPIEDYFKLLLKEVQAEDYFKLKKVRSIYFGGGTPSLCSIDVLEKLMSCFQKNFKIQNSVEVGLEINPGSLNKKKYTQLKDLGFNRFSLGVQTFKPRLLKACGRDHSPEDSIKDLEILSELNLNYSADLLFGLPNQNLEDLKEDLKTFAKFKPPHISPYNLTLPKKHPFNKGRAPDDEQSKMMDLIEESLMSYNCLRYEISNFAQTGCESKHNLGYWNDFEYLGLGLGAHSYAKNTEWGTRFWNTGSYTKYEESLNKQLLKHRFQEVLLINEALTDFLHTSLRQLEGLSRSKLINKFGEKLPKSLWSSFKKLEQNNLIFYKDHHWRLSSTGLKIPNEVFKELCFLKEDFDL